MARVRTNAGYEIGYAESGGGEKTPIVFLHGVGSDKSVWHPQLAHFGEERRTLAFDYPGYGDSDPAPEGTTRDDYAAAIVFGAGRARGRKGARLRPLARRGGRDRHPRCRARCVRVADTRRHVRLAPRWPGYLRPFDRRQREYAVLAEGRVDVLLAQPADPAVRSEVIETMARIDPAAFRIGAQAVWLADQADRADAIRVPTLGGVRDGGQGYAPGAIDEPHADDPRRAL